MSRKAEDAEDTVAGNLEALIHRTLREAPEILALAVGDEQGLPIVDATGGGSAGMSLTATATLTLRSATQSADLLGLQAPDAIVVHAPDGYLLLVTLRGSARCLVAQLRPEANIGLALVVMRRLGQQLSDILDGLAPPGSMAPAVAPVLR